MGYVIRLATETDAEEILGCLHAAFEPYRREYTPDGFRDATLERPALLDRLRSMAVFVALSDSPPSVLPVSSVVGTIACRQIEEGVGYIRSMAVRPQVQGSGLGGRLLRRAEDDLRRRGCNVSVLHTVQPLTRAIAFYEKKGYRLAGDDGDFFGMRLLEYRRDLRR